MMGFAVLRRLVVVIFLMGLVIGCSATRVVPIQMARVPQTESFVQTFDLSEFQNAPAWFYNNDHHRTKDAFMDGVFSQLIGPRNWQNLKDIYTFESLQQELDAADIYVDGTVNLVIYLHPVRQEQSILEGNGRYSIIRKKNREILFSGDFRIKPDLIPIEDLYSGAIIINTEFYVTRIPRHTTYYWEAPFSIELFIDNRRKQDGIFSIAYGRSHNVYLNHPNGAAQQGPVKIGQIVFDDEASPAKFIDTRMMKYLEDDYETKLDFLD